MKKHMLLLTLMASLLSVSNAMELVVFEDSSRSGKSRDNNFVEHSSSSKSPRSSIRISNDEKSVQPVPSLFPADKFLQTKQVTYDFMKQILSDVHGDVLRDGTLINKAIFRNANKTKLYMYESITLKEIDQLKPSDHWAFVASETLEFSLSKSTMLTFMIIDEANLNKHKHIFWITCTKPTLEEGPQKEFNLKTEGRIVDLMRKDRKHKIDEKYYERIQRSGDEEFFKVLDLKKEDIFPLVPISTAVAEPADSEVKSPTRRPRRPSLTIFSSSGETPRSVKINKTRKGTNLNLKDLKVSPGSNSC